MAYYNDNGFMRKTGIRIYETCSNQPSKQFDYEYNIIHTDMSTHAYINTEITYIRFFRKSDQQFL